MKYSARVTFISLTLGPLLTIALAADIKQAQTPGILAIVNANVIDVEKGSVRPNMNFFPNGRHLVL